MSKGLGFWQRLAKKDKLSPEFKNQIERNIKEKTYHCFA